MWGRGCEVVEVWKGADCGGEGVVVEVGECGLRNCGLSYCGRSKKWQLGGGVGGSEAAVLDAIRRCVCRAGLLGSDMCSHSERG